MLKHPLLIIIDGMSQAYRAYYAIRGLSTSQGLPTNAVYGFAIMLKRVIDKFPPDYIAVALDSSAPTLRHTQYESYKATRKKMPSELSEQIPYIRKFCAAMRIPAIALPGYEADDIIATVVRRAVEAGIHPVIVTMDKDLYQLVDTTLILNTAKDDMIVDRDKVQEIFGVTPEQIPDLLGLSGDSSDNIPGAPGIGEKGARDLIQRFGSIEACLDRAEEVPNARQRASLTENREQILMSKRLVTVDTNVPITVDFEEFAVKPPERAALVPLLKELEFTALIKEYLPPDNTPAVEVVSTGALPEIGDRVFLDVREGRASLWTGSGPVHDMPLDERLLPALTNPAVHKVTAGLKSTIFDLRRRGLDLAPPYDDPLLMAFLLFPNRGKYELEDVVFDVFGETISGGGLLERAPERAPWIAKLWAELSPRVEHDVARVYHEIEVPLAPVLVGVEQAGIGIDVAVLERMSAQMSAQMDDLTRRIYDTAGCAFNINSPRQLGEILFDKLNLPHSRKLRKSGQYSTSVEVLEELAGQYDLPRLVLEFRQFAKFKSTYIDAMPRLIDPADGRLHTSFNQMGAATGRLSSSNPNLQNIPVRTDLGRRIRGAFVPRPGWRFVAADYSQVELRIVAHLSGDEKLIESFLAGEDVHRRTAAEVLGVDIAAVTPAQRERAKAVNFGIVYGQTPFGLAQQLGITPEEAAEFIDRYFERYRGVQNYIASVLSGARESGVTRTFFGRLRQHPDINSSNGMKRSMAERTAINSPIQGTAADIIKLAMIRIDDELRRRKLQSRMTLQVHDELIFEVPAGEDGIAEMVRDIMQGVVEFRVPLTVDLKEGQTWEELG
ncbi:MAG TPA: DNA polymerase I [Terriglobia bacterium]|nr:DNA polymerase I [Terriglobia bacterium]